MWWDSRAYTYYARDDHETCKAIASPPWRKLPCGLGSQEPHSQFADDRRPLIVHSFCLFLRCFHLFISALRPPLTIMVFFWEQKTARKEKRKRCSIHDAKFYFVLHSNKIRITILNVNQRYPCRLWDYIPKRRYSQHTTLYVAHNTLFIVWGTRFEVGVSWGGFRLNFAEVMLKPPFKRWL